MSNGKVAIDTPDNKAFLQVVFGGAWQEAYVTGFPDDPTYVDPAKWNGRRWREYSAAELAPFSGMNAYFCISLTGDAGRKTAGAYAKNFRSCHCVVLDDVGTKIQAHDVVLALGHPSWRFETSRGNEQWGYLLDRPEPSLRRVKRLYTRLRRIPLTDCGDPSRNMRLPVQVNTKAGLDWRVVVRAWHPDRRFAMAVLEQGAGLEPGPDEAAPAAQGSPQEAPVAPAAAAVVNAPAAASAGPSPPGAAGGVDVIIRQLNEWGWLTGTRTGDGGGWHLRQCPWEVDHTPGARAADERTAVWAGGGFKCWHGHCAERSRSAFIEWFNAELDERSGGAVRDVAQLVMGPIDASEVKVPEIAQKVIDAGAGFLAEYVWVSGQGSFWSRRTRDLVPKAGVDVRYRLPLTRLLRVTGPRGRVVELTPTTWFSRQTGRVVADNVTYWPGETAVFERDGLVFANRWKACDVGAERALAGRVTNAEVRPWLDLVWHVLGSEGPRFVVRALDMLALVIGDPGRKPGWHLIVQGGQGIGKDLLATPVVWAVGADNVGRVTAAGLHRDHNPWAEKRLIVVSELKQTSAGAQNGRDQYNVLKALAENTSDTIPINEKNVRLYHARNVGAFYVTSNEVDALALDADDRRFAVCASTAGKWPAGQYAALVAWLGGAGGDGTALVAAWLRQRWARVSRMPGRLAALMGNAPWTASKIAMIEAADPVRAWTREQIESGVWPDLMLSSEVSDAYRNAVRQGELRYPVPPQRWARLLRDLGGAKVYGGEVVPLVDGRRGRMWAVRAPARFSGMSLAALIRAHASAARRGFGYGTVVDFPETE